MIPIFIGFLIGSTTLAAEFEPAAPIVNVTFRPERCSELEGHIIQGEHPLVCPPGEEPLAWIHPKTKPDGLCCRKTERLTKEELMLQPLRILSASRLIETRKEFRSVWGIRLKLSRPVANLTKKNLSIMEDKHSRELIGVMNLSVHNDGSEVVLKFKPETGDFGSGISVLVEVKAGTALADGTHTDKAASIRISTDIGGKWGL
jgi:hypothetical protein